MFNQTSADRFADELEPRLRDTDVDEITVAPRSLAAGAEFMVTAWSDGEVVANVYEHEHGGGYGLLMGGQHFPAGDTIATVEHAIRAAL